LTANAFEKKCRFKHVSRWTHRKSAVSEERNGHDGAKRADNPPVYNRRE